MCSPLHFRNLPSVEKKSCSNWERGILNVYFTMLAGLILVFFDQNKSITVTLGCWFEQLNYDRLFTV